MFCLTPQTGGATCFMDQICLPHRSYERFRSWAKHQLFSLALSPINQPRSLSLWTSLCTAGFGAANVSISQATVDTRLQDT
jgi:hypothetical protein